MKIGYINWIFNFEDQIKFKNIQKKVFDVLGNILRDDPHFSLTDQS